MPDNNISKIVHLQAKRDIVKLLESVRESFLQPMAAAKRIEERSILFANAQTYEPPAGVPEQFVEHWVNADVTEYRLIDDLHEREFCTIDMETNIASNDCYRSIFKTTYPLEYAEVLSIAAINEVLSREKETLKQPVGLTPV